MSSNPYNTTKIWAEVIIPIYSWGVRGKKGKGLSYLLELV